MNEMNEWNDITVYFLNTIIWYDALTRNCVNATLYYAGMMHYRCNQYKTLKIALTLAITYGQTCTKVFNSGGNSGGCSSLVTIHIPIGSIWAKFWQLYTFIYQILHFIRGRPYNGRLILLPILWHIPKGSFVMSTPPPRCAQRMSAVPQELENYS